jgi:EpsI family protein
MKHAVGADHLIYGWFFFAFVIVCLLGIGEVVRRFEKRFLLNDKLDVSETTLLNAKVGFETPKMTILWSFVVIVFLLAGITKSVSIQSDSSTMPVEPSVSLPFDLVADGNSISNWEPAFKNPSSTTLKTMRNDSLSFVYFQAYYSGSADDASRSNGVAGELVSAQNDIFLESKWSISGTGSKQIGSDLRYHFIELSSSFSQKIMVYHLYVIDGQLFTDAKKAKLYQVWLKLQGKPFDGMFIAVSISEDDSATDELDMVLGSIATQSKGAFGNRKGK